MWRSMVDGPLKVCMHRIRRSARTLGRRSTLMPVDRCRSRHSILVGMSLFGLGRGLCVFSGLRDARCSSAPLSLPVRWYQTSSIRLKLTQRRTERHLRHHERKPNLPDRHFPLSSPSIVICDNEGIEPWKPP